MSHLDSSFVVEKCWRLKRLVQHLIIKFSIELVKAFHLLSSTLIYAGCDNNSFVKIFEYYAIHVHAFPFWNLCTLFRTQRTSQVDFFTHHLKQCLHSHSCAINRPKITFRSIFWYFQMNLCTMMKPRKWWIRTAMLSVWKTTDNWREKNSLVLYFYVCSYIYYAQGIFYCMHLSCKLNKKGSMDCNGMRSSTQPWKLDT